MPPQAAVRRAELLPPDGAKVQVSVSSLIPANGILNFAFCKPKIIFFLLEYSLLNMFLEADRSIY